MPLDAASASTIKLIGVYQRGPPISFEAWFQARLQFRVDLGRCSHTFYHGSRSAKGDTTFAQTHVTSETRDLNHASFDRPNAAGGRQSAEVTVPGRKVGACHRTRPWPVGRCPPDMGKLPRGGRILRVSASTGVFPLESLGILESTAILREQLMARQSEVSEIGAGHWEGVAQATRKWTTPGIPVKHVKNVRCVRQAGGASPLERKPCGPAARVISLRNSS
jgi:hypothetical protein